MITIAKTESPHGRAGKPAGVTRSIAISVRLGALVVLFYKSVTIVPARPGVVHRPL